MDRRVVLKHPSAQVSVAAEELATITRLDTVQVR